MPGVCHRNKSVCISLGNQCTNSYEMMERNSEVFNANTSESCESARHRKTETFIGISMIHLRSCVDESASHRFTRIMHSKTSFRIK